MFRKVSEKCTLMKIKAEYRLKLYTVVANLCVLSFRTTENLKQTSNTTDR